MKKLLTFVILFTIIVVNAISQEEKSSNFSANADIYSSFIFRGSKLGTGPAFQPIVKFTTEKLTIGAWGSFDATGYSETDLFFSYNFSFGLSIGITDYYLTDLEFFDVSDTTGSQAFEINVGYTIKGLTLTGNYILNEAEGVGSKGNDMYFQTLYQFKNFNLSIGAGDGWLTTDNEFNICHVGLGTTKIIQITDSFSLPIIGQVVFNPDQEKVFVVVGISF
jgi:hypothetical protein